eukprot:SAG31_NODE_31869_length_363_cov_0.590909_1_plen_104_part_10
MHAPWSSPPQKISIKELRARARELGASDEQMEAAADSEQLREAWVTLVDSLTPKNRELCASAAEYGATASHFQEALDNDHPRQALMTLVESLQMQSLRGVQPAL